MLTKDDLLYYIRDAISHGAHYIGIKEDAYGQIFPIYLYNDNDENSYLLLLNLKTAEEQIKDFPTRAEVANKKYPNHH